MQVIQWLKQSHTLTVCLFLNIKVILWRSRVTRQVIDNLKSYQKPNQLVGHIIEMAMVLVGCRPSSLTGGGHTRESVIVYPNGEEQSGKFSQSSGSTSAVRKSNKGVMTCFPTVLYFKTLLCTIVQLTIFFLNLNSGPESCTTSIWVKLPLPRCVNPAALPMVCSCSFALP